MGRAFALTDYESAAIGCKGVSQSYQINFQSSVDILDSVLKNQNASERVATVNAHIERQIKYLIGISKQYKTLNISKLAFSAYRIKPTILSETKQMLQLPKLESYWASNIHFGDDPYVAALTSYSNRRAEMDQITYQSQVLATVCAPLPLASEVLFQQLSNLFYPVDPYLGFWVNTENERTVRTVKNRSTGLIPNCLSDDFLIYGTSPDYGWYYWQPIHRRQNAICKIENQTLITQFNVQSILPVSFNPNIKMFTESVDMKLQTLTAVFGQVERLGNLALSYRALAEDIQNILKQCQTQNESLACYSAFQNYLTSKAKMLDDGQIGLIHFLKNYTELTQTENVKVRFVSDNYFSLQLNGKNKANQNRTSLLLYGGPTGIFQSYKASTEYWDLVASSLYESDLFLYFGHAGTGKNLSLNTILQNTKLKNLKPRSKDLNLGIFNCEGYSYYGWDLNSIFKKDDKSYSINMVASSGVEVSSLFISAYVENFLKFKNMKVGDFVENMSKYVQSDDFLSFQKIPVQ